MIFNFYNPAPPLSKFVDNFWLYEGYEAEHKTERILPTGTLELVINLRQNELRFYDADRPENCSRLSGDVVAGAYGRGFAPDTVEDTFIIGEKPHRTRHTRQTLAPSSFLGQINFIQYKALPPALFYQRSLRQMPSPA